MRLIPDLDAEGEMRIKLESKEEEKVIEVLKTALYENVENLPNAEEVGSLIEAVLTYNANGILGRVDGRLDRV